MIVRYIAAAAAGAAAGAYLMHISKMHQPAPTVAPPAAPERSAAEQTASLILSLFDAAGGPPPGQTPRPLTAGQERQ